MKLFSSHSLADRAFAERLTTRIQALGRRSGPTRRSSPAKTGTRRFARLWKSSDGIVLVVPEPGTAKANSAFFEAGAARALGKPVVAVIPEAEPSRVGELPADVYGLAVFDGSHVGPEALAEKIVSALKAA